MAETWFTTYMSKELHPDAHGLAETIISTGVAHDADSVADFLSAIYPDPPTGLAEDILYLIND